MVWTFKKPPAQVIPPVIDENPKKFTHVNNRMLSWDELTKLSPQEVAKKYHDVISRSFGRTVSALEKLQPIDLVTGTAIAMDADVKVALDNNMQQVKSFVSQNQGFLAPHILDYYSTQGFIGWQICAILMQNWFINKACKMPGQDAVRHGWDRTVNGGVKVSPEIFDHLRECDKRFKLKNNLTEHSKFSRGFGLRHTLFLVDGIDYELPFNIDGVKPGSYKGMTQIDPYWLAPMFNMEDAADPYSQNFYNPTWWMVNGRKIHRTHFIISRNGNELADLLKPAYFYGGMSTPQLIYERIYAAERTANEAPLLAMTKRLFTLKTDTSKAWANLDAFWGKVREWCFGMNNMGVKVIGEDEEVQQIDTSLAEFNQTIETQYSLGCAAAEIPESRMMSRTPKGGLGSEGGYDEGSYGQTLESIQENELSPIIERHTQICQRSEQIAVGVNFEVKWNDTQPLTDTEKAAIRLSNAQADVALVSTGGINGEDVRKRLISDPDSGYDGMEFDVEEFNEADADGEPASSGEGDDDASAEAEVLSDGLTENV